MSDATDDCSKHSASVDCYSGRVVLERGQRPGSQLTALCAGLHDHRVVPDAVPLGGLPLDQGGSQSSYHRRSARSHSGFRAYHHRQGARRQCARLDRPARGDAIAIVDRGYRDFARLQSLHQSQVSFVIRAKDNLRYTWVASREVDKSTGLRSDQSILLATPKSKLAYPERLRRVSFRDPGTDKFLVFPTNRFDLEGGVDTICAIGGAPSLTRCVTLNG